MRIGIDISSTKDQFKNRAIGNYTRHLVAKLKKIAPENEYVLFGHFYPWRVLRSTAFDIFIKPEIKKVHLDVFLQPNFEAGLPIGVCPTVVMMHDLIPLVRDRYSQKGFLADQIKKFFYLRNLSRVKKVDAVLANSEWTRSDLVKYVGVDSGKVNVTYLGIGEEFQWSASQLVSLSAKEDYILYVGGVEENKNLERLIEAFAQIKKTAQLSNCPTVKLILAGSQFIDEGKVETRRIIRLIEELGLEDSVERPGFIPQKDLPDLYQKALVFVYPSLYEGFGLPPLEAMASGTPAVVSNASSLPEVCGDAAIYVDPLDVSDIARGINHILSHLDTPKYPKLVEKGREWVKRYSWQKCAQETLGVLESVT